MSERFFVLYKGEEIESSGTLQEIADKTGRKLNTMQWMLSPTAKKRASNPKYSRNLSLIEVEDD